MKNKILNSIFFFSLMGVLFSQDASIYSIKGDKFYKDSNYTEAEEAYRKANDLKPEFKNSYNIGNTLYQQGRAKEASEAYEKSVQQFGDSKNKSNAYYNLGNAFFNQKIYDKSINAYQNALKINPKDKEAKQNLVLAKKQKQIQEKQQQKQQQESQENKQEEKKDEQKSSEEGKQKEEKNSKKTEEKQSAKQNDKKDDAKEPKNEAEKNKMNKDQAEQLLRMVDDQDKKIRERIQNSQSRSPKRDKDW